MINKSGKLRIYLGMSAGVGKTYSMLADARRDSKRGVDVVLGYLEMHGRQETEILAEGLEVIPRVKIDYQGRSFEEFNIDAVLQRRPQVILVDELAHSNIPGARNKKRYQDIDEILSAGIDVRTTLNIQHLESLVGHVKQVSGVSIQETVPDSFLSGAEIEVVDITPEQLLVRLKEGKVYKDTKAPNALENFFREENLTALRELLLRASADRVETDLLKFRAHTRERNVWGSKERILVCVAPNAISTEVVREGYRMASSIKGELVVLSVESAQYSELSPGERQYSEEALRVARSLGARTITKIGNDIALEILEVAHSENISQIFLGKPPRSNFFLRRVTLIDRLISQSKDIDIHLVQLVKPAEHSNRKPNFIVTRAFSWKDLPFAIGFLGILTALLLPIRNYLENINVVMAYLLVVCFVATRCNKRTAIISAFSAVLAFDFFFVPPFNTFAISDFKYAFVFLTMLVVGLTISLLTSRVKAHSSLLHDREERTNVLFGLSQAVSGAQNFEELQVIVTTQLNIFLKMRAVLSFKCLKPDLVQDIILDDSLNSDDIAVVMWVFNNGKPAGYNTDTLAAAEGYHLPIKFSGETIGVLSIFNRLGLLNTFQSWTIESFLSPLAHCMERLSREEVLRQLNTKLDNEKMRSVFLSSISHDLRTPLAAIQGAAGLMTEMDADSIDQLRMLASTIEDESEKLSSIIRNVLELTRVRSDGFKLNSGWVDIEDIIGSAIRRLERVMGDRKVIVNLSHNLPLVYLDELLVEQLVVNLLENSLKYGPKISAISIDLSVQREQENDILEIIVSDKILESEIVKRASTDPSILDQSSYGLGYQICSAIMTAHGGEFQTIKLANNSVKSICRFPLLKKPPEGPIE